MSQEDPSDDLQVVFARINGVIQVQEVDRYQESDDLQVVFARINGVIQVQEDANADSSVEGAVDMEAQKASKSSRKRKSTTGTLFCAKCAVHGRNHRSPHHNCTHKDCRCPNGCYKVQLGRDQSMRHYYKKKERMLKELETVAGLNGGSQHGPIEAEKDTPEPQDPSETSQDKQGSSKD